MSAAQRETPAPDYSIDLAHVTREECRNLAGPALRTFANIAVEWGLSKKQCLAVLGQPARATYYNWLRKAQQGETVEVPLDTLLRISAVLGIYKDLQILFASVADQKAWLHAENDGLVFGRQAPVEFVTSGTQDSLMLVRRYLDAWRGGQFTSPVSEVDTAEPLTADDIVFV